MMFWILAAMLTALVTAVLMFPLARSGAASAASGGTAAQDGTVYRDQLAELQRDVAEGNLAGDEADGARAEIARRLLKAAAEERHARQSGPPPSLRRAATVLVVVLVPAVALGTYLRLGSPGLPSEPLAAREAGPGGDRQLADLVGKAESHLRSNPDDGRGWDVLAPIYFRTGRVQDAAIAYGNAIRLLGSTARREAGLGEALAMENGGRVTDAAAEAFRKALKLEPDDPKARFFLAVRMAQAGDGKAALQAFRELERKAPPDAPWLPAVRNEIASLGGSASGGSGEGRAQPAPPGNPTAGEMAAAGKMSAGDRTAMIRGMVTRLDAELARQPDNLAGWKRLVRSYMVLGEPAKAKAALGRALKAFPAASDGGKELTELATNLGVSGKEANE